MTISIFMLAAAAAASGNPLHHNVQVHHAGSPIDAIYTARADIETRTIGANLPNRADMRRCVWTATIVVERQLEGSPATPRVISSDKQMKGNRAGPCSDVKRTSIEQEVAGRHDAIRSHLLAVAEKDHAPLLAEVSVIRTVGTN